ncbi:MAG: transposase, partial [Oscillospiraceae bacterium]|nr:transposase [Oscillospiraceae bacterium]
MTIILEEQGIDNAIQKQFGYFIKRFKINKLLREVGAAKEKGVSVYVMFSFLLSLVFTRKNLYETMALSRTPPSFSKNAVYRFLSRRSINWEAFIKKLSVKVIPEVDKLTSEERKTVLILDDTPFWRDRSKKVEMLSRCYDHSEKKYYKGFTMMNLGWSDGQTFVPVDFRLLASGNDKNLLEGSHIEEDGRTLATKRRAEARKDKPSLSLRMLEDAKGTSAQTKYVLFDSWFASPSFMLSVKGLGYDCIARLKNHENYRYLYNGEALSISKIHQMNKKRRGRSRYLLSVMVEIRHKDFEDTVPAKIVYVRDRVNRKNWIALISTDI